MPPAAHPLLDVLADDDFSAEVPLKQSSVASSLPSTTKHSNDALAKEVLPPTILRMRKIRDEDALVDSSDHSSDDDDELNSICHARSESMESIKSTPSTASNGSSPSSSAKKNVHFPKEKAVQVIETIHVFDYTEEELAATFYSTKDMRTFKRERRDLARLLDQGFSAEEIEVRTGTAVRGIETATYDGNRHRHDHIAEGTHGVMMEQDLQYEDCKWNPNSIAYVYHRASEESLREAYKRGLEDEQEVMEELERIRQEFHDLTKQSTADSNRNLRSLNL
jgi:hypothetical protein